MTPEAAHSDPTPSIQSAVPVIVAIGSNLGAAIDHVRTALHRLRQQWPRGFRASSLWDTTPVDCPPDSPRFLNAVVLFDPLPSDEPESVLATLQAWEREAGRAPRIVPNEPRVLDLDLIAFSTAVRSQPDLILPHPRAHRRRFVLAPLDEIAPDLILPTWSGPVRSLLRNLDSTETVRRILTLPPPEPA